jgi:hypothetical protein
MALILLDSGAETVEETSNAWGFGAIYVGWLFQDGFLGGERLAPAAPLQIRLTGRVATARCHLSSARQDSASGTSCAATRRSTLLPGTDRRHVLVRILLMSAPTTCARPMRALIPGHVG